MLTQEEYVQRVLALKDQGWSITEIASAVGYHPATVSKWLKQGGPPEKRIVNPIARVVDDRWARRIDKLIAPPSKLLSTSVFEIIGAEGYSGSYPSAVRHVRARRGPRFWVGPQVSVPIETEPAEDLLCGIPHSDFYGAPGNMRRGQHPSCSALLKQLIHASSLSMAKLLSTASPFRANGRRGITATVTRPGLS